MMERVYINDIKQFLEREILLQGFVENIRDSRIWLFLY